MKQNPKTKQRSMSIWDATLEDANDPEFQDIIEALQTPNTDMEKPIPELEEKLNKLKEIFKPTPNNDY